jgi:integrase/recombinase XerD
MGSPAIRVREVRVVGRLAPFAAAFKASLDECGYTASSSRQVMCVMAHLSRWLDEGGMAVADLTPGQVERYLAERRAAGYRSLCSPRGLASLLGMLAGLGVLPPERPTAPGSALEVLLASFQRYLLEERALEACTAAAYTGRARRFLLGCVTEADLSGLSAADVTRAVSAEAEAVSAGSTRYFVCALRSFLRFCFVEGLVGSDLSGAALAVSVRRRSLLPQGLAKGDADALLASCDRRRSGGRRDYAILVTLVRLGLRAGEVAGLMLADCDWRAGEIVVHGKGGRDDRLPLPVEVGEAIAGYLRRGRPISARGEVFLRLVAPVGPLGRGGVSAVVRRACVRAGVAPVGAHRLRHTAACEMLGAGVGLPEIGQVLRHRSLASTAVYARVDLDALRGLARPWPGSDSDE